MGKNNLGIDGDSRNETKGFRELLSNKEVMSGQYVKGAR